MIHSSKYLLPATPFSLSLTFSPIYYRPFVALRRNFSHQQVRERDSQINMEMMIYIQALFSANKALNPLLCLTTVPLCDHLIKQGICLEIFEYQSHGNFLIKFQFDLSSSSVNAPKKSEFFFPC